MSVRVRTVLTVVTVCALLLPLTGFTGPDVPAGLPAGSPDEVPAACVATDDPAAAATDLIDPGAALDSVDVAAGMTSAVVLEPLVHPGTRRRLLEPVEDVWCSAEGFNAAWRLADGSPDPVERASAFAEVAAAPFFDDVTVREATATGPGTVELTTHAATNGVVADWTVTLDTAGVTSATWTATDFAVAPFEASFEGLTALPGATRDYLRGASGTVTTTLLPEVADDPGLYTDGETEDDFRIIVSASDSTVSPNAGEDVGAAPVDFYRMVRDAALENYSEFHAWGLEKGWTSDEGTIYVDDALSAVCLACVEISEEFNMHLSRGALTALEALGYGYPDATEAQAWSNVIGHEMVHNFQNAYTKPDSVGGGRHSAWSEGIARFSETIHSYSHISHQPDSLVYADDTNGCNGWNNSGTHETFAAGPLTDQSYDACYFWLTFYERHGVDFLPEIFEASRGLPDGTPWQIYHGAIEAVSGDVAGDLFNFAAMAITREGYAFGAPADPEAAVHDWARYLEPYVPAELETGGTVTRSLGEGGLMALELPAGETGRVTVDGPDDVDIEVALLVDDGDEPTIDRPDVLDRDITTVAGARTYVIAVRRGVGSAVDVTLGWE